ncbi:MAG: YceI family protein [Sulfurimonas sp.]|nr:YceI family protein [Sulfurimonas sp.]
MKKMILVVLLSLPLFASSLTLTNGSIAAHAEMMMDSEINPLNTKLSADVNMQGDNIKTLSGSFWIDLNLFVSDKKDRDEHMYEALNSTEHKLATYTIISLTQGEEKDMYIVHGKLSFHGNEKELQAKAKITTTDAGLEFKANTSINMPDYGVEMPCMMFMCVDDKVDLVITATFKK